MLCSALIISTEIFAVNVICNGVGLIETSQELARQTAINNSSVSCIRNLLSNLYGEENISNNEFRLNKVYSEADSFISSTRIVSEGFDPDINSYVVNVEAVVNENDLKGYLTENGIVLMTEQTQKVLPLIVERNSSEGEGTFWWGTVGKFEPKKNFSDIEKALASYLSNSNFILIDPFETELSARVPDSYRYMEMKLNELSELGKIFGAAMVASGYVWTVCKRENNASKHTCETTLSVQMVSVQTSKILAAKRTTEKWTAEKEDEARTVSRARACKIVSESLIYQLSKKWDKRNSTNFKVYIKGVRTPSTYSKLRKCMLGNQIAGLYNVVDRYHARGLLVMEGERRSSVNAIESSLVSKCFNDIDYELIQTKQEMIEFRI
jgi:hypothetical protein